VSDNELIDQYRAHGTQLCACATAAVPAWLRRVAIERLGSDARLDDRFDALVSAVQLDVRERLTRLAEADIDEPLSGPLEQIRQAASPVTALLRELGAQPGPRDEAVVRMFPEDVLGIGPAAASELGQDVHDASIAWGAAKAYVHLNRRRG
jgi:hypothetical protein